MDQERVDTKSLMAVRKELIHTSLLHHKDKGVKAYVACCLADLLRLYAPDAPYTADELRDIFQFFFKQLTSGLKGPDAPYYSQYFYLLESLSTIKSVVLVCDLPSADELITEIFRDFFDLISQNMAKNVEMFMSDILVALIDEAQTLPSELLNTILAQFMQKSNRQDTAALRLAVDVCNRTAERLQRNVSQVSSSKGLYDAALILAYPKYFTDIILQHDEDDDEIDHIRSAHDLIISLNKSCPALLLNVVPQLEEELKVDRLQLRTLATQVLGEMFGELKNGVELSRKYHAAWQAWLTRKNDKAVAVRLAMVEATKSIIINHAEMRNEIEEVLRLKLYDPEEKVRAAVCKVYSQVDFETALHHISADQLKEIASRCMDKKRSVRQEAFACLGRLYRLAFTEIESNDALTIEQFGWIPDLIFQSASMSPEVKNDAFGVIYRYILPLPSKGEDEATWTEQLLIVAKDLEERGMAMLLSMSNLKSSRPTIYEKFVECCISNNGGIIDENEEEIARALSKVIQIISSMLPDPSKAAEDLNSFAKANESRLYKLFKTCVDTQSDLKSIAKSSSEFLRRVEQTLPNALDTLTSLLQHASLSIINQSSVPTLIKRLQQKSSRPTPNPEYSHSQTQQSHRNQSQSQTQASELQSNSTAQILAIRAKSILVYAAKNCPAIFKPHVVELARAISSAATLPNGVDDDDDDVIMDEGERAKTTYLEVCMQCLAAAVRMDPELAPTDKRTVDRLVKLGEGDYPRIAKFAARILAHSKNRLDVCSALMEKLALGLPNATEDRLVANLAVFAQFAGSAPQIFEEKSEVVIDHLVKTVLMTPSPKPKMQEDGEDEWGDLDQLGALTKAKLLSIKICANRCLSNASAPTAIDMSTPVFRMLWNLLENSGSFDPHALDDPQVKSRIRLQAALSLLKLSQVSIYCKIVTAHLPLLALTVQDTCFNVRHTFLCKLTQHLALRKLDPRFNVIAFLTAHDPEKEIRDRARSYITTYFQRSTPDVRLSNFEMIFIRFLHLLAHHPDFSTDAEGLLDMAKYVEFYVDVISSSDNISLLYHLAMKAKSVRDAESDKYNENLYVMSELAQHILKARAKAQSWNLPSYPGKIKLPIDIFKPHPNQETANKVFRTAYLSEEALSSLEGIGKAWKSPKSKQPQRPPAKRKQPSARNGQAGAKSKRRKKINSSDEEESPATDSDDGDVFMKSDNEVKTENATHPETDESDIASDEPEAVGRGARTRNAKIRRKRAAKSKAPS
ncbi:hypothetical protein FRC02_008159 [Tulasnella sp. 418]|nr:hypothetical protein FRC02_008159 [Tulasnella sp. 418]